MADNNKYTVTSRGDGGYTLDIFVSKRVWKMITSEGFFPKQEYGCIIEIIGEGQQWTEQVKGIDGYFYSLDKIESKKKYWDIGYAWIDPNRDHLYLNLYWVSAPDKIVPAGVNGKYKLK